MKTTASITILILLFIANSIFSQVVTQIVKGNVFDNEPQTQFIGVTIVILDTGSIIGATTDLEGNYKLVHVSLGHYNIQFSDMGYDPVIVSEILECMGISDKKHAGIADV